MKKLIPTMLLALSLAACTQSGSMPQQGMNCQCCQQMMKEGHGCCCKKLSSSMHGDHHTTCMKPAQETSAAPASAPVAGSGHEQHH